MTMTPVPDRFGCGQIAAVLLGALFILLVVAEILMATGLRNAALFQGAGAAAVPGARGPGNPNALGGGGSVPSISDRFFSSGSVESTVTGDLSFDVDLSIDQLRSYVKRDLAWIAFGGETGTTVLVSFHEPENSVAISDNNGHTALGVDDQCVFNVTVTAALVSGHVSCPQAQALHGGERVGTTAIELDFSAGTAPGSAGSGDPGDDPEGSITP
jgi:hypothetical protein